MLLIRNLLFIGLFVCAQPAFSADNELGWTLDSALKQIGRQADDFETVLSDVSVIWSDSEGKTTREATGRIYMNRKAQIRLNVSDPQERVYLIDDREVQEYSSRHNLVEVYSRSKHKNRLEPFIRLGFSESGKDLKDNFLVTMLGEDKIGSARVLGLELTPKKDALRQTVSKMTLWIDEASWMPVRQVIAHVTHGETLTLNYSGMARNLNLNDELFRDDWPKGTQKIRK